MIREITVMNSFAHKNIMSSKFIKFTAFTVRIFMELGKYDLYNWLINADYSNFSTRALAKSIIFDIIVGLREFHSKGFIHRDIKLENIILFNNMDNALDKNTNLFPKITDFGLSSHVDIYSSPLPRLYYACTRGYIPPEILLGAYPDKQSIDIWSLGCLIVRMLSRSDFLRVSTDQDDNAMAQLFYIFRTFGTPDNDSWVGMDKLRDYKPTFPKWDNPGKLAEIFHKSRLDLSATQRYLILRMFEYDPTKRITINEIHDEWFK